MAHVEINEVQAWLEPTKLTISALDVQQETQIAAAVLARVVVAYPTQVAGWTGPTNTPVLIRSIIAMKYAGWFYDKTYSENPDDNGYADRLRASAEDLILGIISGAVDIIEVPGDPTIGEPAFYPTDVSSLPDAVPTLSDPSAGPPKFSMGKIF